MQADISYPVTEEVFTMNAEKEVKDWKLERDIAEYKGHPYNVPQFKEYLIKKALEHFADRSPFENVEADRPQRFTWKHGAASHSAVIMWPFRNKRHLKPRDVNFRPENRRR
jgi:hypothetical protein